MPESLPITVLTFAVLAAICIVVGLLVVTTLRGRRRDAQFLELLATFGPVVERARSDPRVLLAWYPVAQAARMAFPESFAAIEQDGPGRFPFGPKEVEAAHARWTADWLEWEENQDAEHRQQVEILETENGPSTDAESRRVLEALEREKLGRYQRRYEDYVRISRSLSELAGSTSSERGGGEPG